ncbi:hypothetical protein D3C71_2216010 [compost metagenome]
MLGAHGQCPDLVCNNREASPLLSGTRRLYRGIKREQVRLDGYRINHIDDLANPFTILP